LIKIAIDAMGGDLGPSEVIKGVSLALKEYPVDIALIGRIDAMKECISALPLFPASRVTLHNANDVVAMSDPPLASFKKKKDSSIRVGLNLVKEKQADGFVSAGNTGAVMLTSTLILGKIEGIERPAITTVLPSKLGPVVILDMGSNVDCKPRFLSQFAEMGNLYSECVLGIKKPRVGLLNIGEESGKGNSVTQEAFSLINELPLNFIGNIEGKDVLFGSADVVVCDGFVGNSILKFGEGVTKLFFDFFKNEAKGSFLSKLGLALLKPALKRFKKEFDYAEFGGAPLLGIKGVSIVAHGKSNAYAIKNAIRICYQAIENNMVEKISAGMK
jgi:phosphate acyltransferase